MRQRFFAAAAIAAVTGFAAAANAGSLSTKLSTTIFDRHGLYFDLTAINSVSINSFDVSPTSQTDNFSVWYKSGTYAGNELTSAAWTLDVTINAVAGIVTIDPVIIAAGSTDGFYVYDNSGVARYNVGIATYSNADLSFTGGTGNYAPAFSNTLANRVFAGKINYTNVPEPASLAILGVALAGLGVVRRRMSV